MRHNFMNRTRLLQWHCFISDSINDIAMLTSDQDLSCQTVHTNITSPLRLSFPDTFVPFSSKRRQGTPARSTPLQREVSSPPRGGDAPRRSGSPRRRRQTFRNLTGGGSPPSSLRCLSPSSARAAQHRPRQASPSSPGHPQMGPPSWSRRRGHRQALPAALPPPS